MFWFLNIYLSFILHLTIYNQFFLKHLIFLLKELICITSYFFEHIVLHIHLSIIYIFHILVLSSVIIYIIIVLWTVCCVFTNQTCCFVQTDYSAWTAFVLKSAHIKSKPYRTLNSFNPTTQYAIIRTCFILVQLFW